MLQSLPHRIVSAIQRHATRLRDAGPSLEPRSDGGRNIETRGSTRAVLVAVLALVGVAICLAGCSSPVRSAEQAARTQRDFAQVVKDIENTMATLEAVDPTRTSASQLAPTATKARADLDKASAQLSAIRTGTGAIAGAQAKTAYDAGVTSATEAVASLGDYVGVLEHVVTFTDQADAAFKADSKATGEVNQSISAKTPKDRIAHAQKARKLLPPAIAKWKRLEALNKTEGFPDQDFDLYRKLAQIDLQDAALQLKIAAAEKRNNYTRVISLLDDSTTLGQKKKPLLNKLPESSSWVEKWMSTALKPAKEAVDKAKEWQTRGATAPQ